MSLRWVVFAGLLASAAACQAGESWREPNTGMEFVALPKGCFKMGVPHNAFAEQEKSLFAARARSEMPDHEVCLDAFWLGRYEVRAAEWQQVMGDRRQTGAPDAPATRISWEDAQAFVRKLNEMSGGSERFRLPTEAEWEYACRASAPATTWVPGRNELEDKAWFSSPYAGPKGERLKAVQPAGRKAANAFGLHDMLGNAWEWVADGYLPDAYSRHALYNPVIDEAPAAKRVIRGGSYRTDRHMTRCEARSWMPASETQDTIGFRLVRIR